MKPNNQLLTNLTPDGRSIITESQKEIICHLCDGLKGPEVAELMRLSNKTIENQRHLAMCRLKHQGVHNTYTMVKWAIASGVYKL